MAKSQSKTENRGGARKNTGPKPTSISATQLAEMRKAAFEKAEETGVTLFAICLGWIYDKDVAFFLA